MRAGQKTMDCVAGCWMLCKPPSPPLQRLRLPPRPNRPFLPFLRRRFTKSRLPLPSHQTDRCLWCCLHLPRHRLRLPRALLVGCGALRLLPRPVPPNPPSCLRQTGPNRDRAGMPPPPVQSRGTILSIPRIPSSPQGGRCTDLFRPQTIHTVLLLTDDYSPLNQLPSDLNPGSKERTSARSSSAISSTSGATSRAAASSAAMVRTSSSSDA